MAGALLKADWLACKSWLRDAVAPAIKRIQGES